MAGAMSVSLDGYMLDADQAAIFESLADEIHRHAFLGTVPTHTDIARWERQFDLLDYDWRQEVAHHERLARSPKRPRLFLVKPRDSA
jgi:hypothetical protein